MNQQSDNKKFSADSPLPSHGKWGRARVFAYALIFVAALLVGAFFGKRVIHAVQMLVPNQNSGGKVAYWTSPHDPGFHSDTPGKDAMGMDLVPVYAGQQVTHGPTVIDPVISEHEYASVPVEKGPLVRTIHTIGTIEYVEPLIGDVTLKINGWLEKLYVDYEGQPVHRGDPLFDLYSPELVATQQEFLISLQAWQQAKQTNNPAVLESAEQNLNTARQRMRFWDVTDQQIDELARTGKTRKSMTFYSPFDGIVVEKQAFEGKYLPAGQLLYRVADLSKVWAYVFVYQNQLHCVSEGQDATLSLANLPGRAVQGKVIYVYPYLDPKNRAAKVRLEFENPELVLKPGMFADILLSPHQLGAGIRIPQNAILKTGERSLVYLSEPGHKFRAQEVSTGMELDHGMIEILTGLKEGQQIVAAPSFLMDSESRIRAVNRRFGPAPNWTQQMPGMKMPGMEQEEPMPGMEHGEQMPGMEYEEPMPEMKHEKSMPGMKHEEPMPGMKGEQPMPGMEHEPEMPAMKGDRP